MNRRSLAAACLVGAPLVYEISRFVWPRGSEGSLAQQVAVAGAHPVQWFSAGLLEAVSASLLVPAVITLAARLTGRGQVFGRVAATLAVLSSFAFSGEAVGEAALVVMGGQQDRGRMVALWTDIMGSGYLTVFIVLLFAGLLGQLLLPWAACVGGLVRWWVPALSTMGFVAVTVAPDGIEGATAALLYLPVLAGYALLAAALVGSRRPALPVVATPAESVRA